MTLTPEKLRELQDRVLQHGDHLAERDAAIRQGLSEGLLINGELVMVKQSELARIMDMDRARISQIVRARD